MNKSAILGFILSSTNKIHYFTKKIANAFSPRPNQITNTPNQSGAGNNQAEIEPVFISLIFLPSNPNNLSFLPKVRIFYCCY